MKLRTGFRCEVWGIRPGAGWLVFDEYRPQKGRPGLSRAAYEKWLTREHPMLARREWRVVEFETAPIVHGRAAFTIQL